MPRNVQLFSVAQLIAAAALDENLYDIDIEVSAKAVQDEYVEGTIGTCLFNRLCDLVETGDIDKPDNIAYKRLLVDYVLYVVAWGVRYDIEPQLQNKIRNAGVTNSTDEHLVTVAQNIMFENMGRYKRRMQFYAKALLKYVQDNKDIYKEFEPCGNSCSSTNSGSGYLAGIAVD